MKEYCIEGIPVIIRFKTIEANVCCLKSASCIEGIPVIIRFKTECLHKFNRDGVNKY